MKRIIYDFPKKINFVFEHDYLNLVSCSDINQSGLPRTGISPIATVLIDFESIDIKFIKHDFKKFMSTNSNEKYIIASNVAHSPHDWCGEDFKGIITSDHYDRKNLFCYLNAKYIEDLQKGKAFLLLDQTHEGYQADFLFDWFHNTCNHFNISPKQIIYMTGNLNVSEQYDVWLKEKNFQEKMLVIGVALFEYHIASVARNRIHIDKNPILPVEKNIKYKGENLRKIKLCDVLQKRPRGHRIWLFHELYVNNLFNDCVLSMNKIKEYEHVYYAGKTMEHEIYKQLNDLLPILPPNSKLYNVDTELTQKVFASSDSSKWIEFLNDDIAINTWLSVVSEASFAEDTCFLSEKIFKPIAIGQPFIIYGNKNSLQKLRDLGYRTFHPFINEDYDKLDTWDRLQKIIESLNAIKQMSDKEKLEWYKGMSDILAHNQETLAKNALNSNPFFKKILVDYVRK